MSSLLEFHRVKTKDQEWHKFLAATSAGKKHYLAARKKEKEMPWNN